jgi:uncharacterized protein
MFGISFAKILLLVAVIAVVWFGYRWFQRWEKERRTAVEELARLRARDGREPRGAARDAEEMSACRVCGAFVVARAATACGRKGCPFPR